MSVMPWVPFLWVTYCPLLGASTGFCKFSDKKEPVLGLLFRNYHHSRKNCNSSGPILRKNAESQMEILPRLLAILSSLQGYVANRPSGARHAAAGSGGISMSYELWSACEAGDTDETDMHNSGNINLNAHNRISIGFDLFGKPVELSKLGKQQQHRPARKSELGV